MAGTTTRTASSTGAQRASIAEFERTYEFRFDSFQRRACEALVGGSSVLVAAPTGAGKTVVGEFAAWLAMRGGGKTFYTTPIKALSNQKYKDLSGIHGAHNVGLLTGDNSINGEAPIVVMTTEVLRNMIYEDSRLLDAIHYVVLDEVHYLQDPYRGAVWEEILIHLPVDVQTISLSATVSNAEEFGEWLQTLRGRVEVVIEEQRPVEIRHWYFASDELLPMFVTRPDGDPIPNPRGAEFDRRRRRGPDRPQRGDRRTRQRRARIPYRSEVIERLDSEGMLPAIYFIFSRRGCDDAVRQCLAANRRLTSSKEAAQIVAHAEDSVADLTPEELTLLGYDEWIEGLRRGLAAHHAGMIPPFKETVEQLFSEGLVKAVFATETLALGINMPARTVVVESLVKFTGEKHEMMTPGEYTQLSGRAGRRGIDEIGHSVVLLQKFIRFDAVTRLATTRTYPLQSSFQPSYNMAVNLVRNYERADAEHLVNSSFGQFQADRDVVQLEKTREQLEAYLASYRERMRCDAGDFEEYFELHRELRALEDQDRSGRRRARSEQILEAISVLRPGDVFFVAGGKRKGRYAVVEVTRKKNERRPRVLAISEERSMVRFGPAEFREPPQALGTVALPQEFDVRDARARRHVARRLARMELRPHRSEGRRREGSSGRASELRSELEAHPCHGCRDLGRHLHFAERAERLTKQIAGIDKRVRRRTGTLARRFERTLEVLEGLGYVDGWALTDKGDALTRVYNESDLLVVEAIERGLLDGLEPREVAAVVSALVYETRGPEPEYAGEMPTRATRSVWAGLVELWRQIREQEELRGLELTREPDPGFGERAYMWASGATLDEVLGYDDAPGDFVRCMKQLVDLLRQLEEVAPGTELADTIRTVLGSINRGVVAYSSVEM